MHRHFIKKTYSLQPKDFKTRNQLPKLGQNQSTNNVIFGKGELQDIHGNTYAQSYKQRQKYSFQLPGRTIQKQKLRKLQILKKRQQIFDSSYKNGTKLKLNLQNCKSYDDLPAITSDYKTQNSNGFDPIRLKTDTSFDEGSYQQNQYETPVQSARIQRIKKIKRLEPIITNNLQRLQNVIQQQRSEIIDIDGVHGRRNSVNQLSNQYYTPKKIIFGQSEFGMNNDFQTYSDNFRERKKQNFLYPQRGNKRRKLSIGSFPSMQLIQSPRILRQREQYKQIHNPLTNPLSIAAQMQNPYVEKPDYFYKVCEISPLFKNRRRVIQQRKQNPHLNENPISPKWRHQINTLIQNQLLSGDRLMKLKSQL